MPQIMLLYTTWPDAETAEAAGAEAVAEGLAACANIGGAIRSVYRWRGAVERSAEIPMLLKTTAEVAQELTAFIAARHPYEAPCILAVPAAEAGSHGPFVDWIERSVGPESARSS